MVVVISDYGGCNYGYAGKELCGKQYEMLVVARYLRGNTAVPPCVPSCELGDCFAELLNFARGA